MANVYDFYKPHLSSEYPEVDGPLTQTCYPTALEMSYDHFRTKESKRLGNAKGDKKDVSIDDFDYFCFHSPYGKLVQKGFARLVSHAAEVRCQFELTLCHSTALQRLPL